MVDFKNKLKNKTIEKKVDPIELYDSLDRRSEAGPLRPSQQAILQEWHDKNRQRRDNIIKLHTGEGKTLIGLLMLQSKLNELNEPCIYLCPNIYLANQARLEARKFGIPICEIDENDNEIPDDFTLGRSILITHVQKLFNGKTKFGLNNKSINVGAVLLDDSHACIDSIRSSLTIKIKKEHNVYQKIIQLFEHDLRNQGEGSYLEILNGGYGTMLPIPYWSWIDRKDEVTSLLLSHKEEREVAFVWPLIKDGIENCQVFISGGYLEISPILTPIKAFGSFSNAKHRMLMSATTQDDAFAIKGLGFDVDAIKSPLTSSLLKWSGEKLIIIPSLIDAGLDREYIVKWLATPQKTNFGIVFLTPDFNKDSQYEKYGALVSDSKSIFKNVQALKSGDYSRPVVFANRYDGIDLPDEACRILILDSKPYFDSLLDRYEEDCRTDSDILNIKIAQKVEQGLGRSVRGEKDYSVILVIGGDLSKFLKSQTTNKYFSPQTRKQIEIGLQAAGFAKDELQGESNSSTVLLDLMNQSLRRDDGWKDYYIEEMKSLPANELPSSLYDVLKLEYDAETAFASGKEDKACQTMQALCDKFGANSAEKGWYTQQLARYRYRISKVDSNETQRAAFTLNTQLLKPKAGVKYKKLDYLNENRVARIRNWLGKFKNNQELQLAAAGLLDNLAFGVASEKFESALKELGEALGFLSQRPDKDIKKGPDNLWCVGNNNYILLECKNEVELTRAAINKHEAGQMNTHCGWFEENYGEAQCKRILIIPTKKLSYEGNFTHEVEVMKQNKLKLLRDNFMGFVMELYKYDLDELGDEKIDGVLNFHKLDVASLNNLYCEPHVKLAK